MAEENEDTSPRDNNNSPPSSGEGKETKQTLAGRFGSVDELEKGFQELEKKLGQQGQELGDARKKLNAMYEYQSYTQPLVQAVDSNPELRNQVLSELGIDEEGQPSQPKTQGKDTDTTAEVKKYVDKQLRDVRSTQESQVIRDFEKEKGILNLDRDKQKNMRAEMGKHLSKWFPQGLKSIPTNQLPDMLEDAYTLANTDSIKSQGKAEGRIEERKAASGALGSIPSGEVPTKDQIQLTSKQKEVAKKQGISEEDYKEQLVAIEKSYQEYGG